MFCDPDWIRTNDRLLRRQVLYPAELPDRFIPSRQFCPVKQFAKELNSRHFYQHYPCFIVDPHEKGSAPSRKKVQLERFNAKGGWTFIRLAEIVPDKGRAFGMRTVKGQIDDYTFDHVNLMPMGNGQLFLPVNATIRKQIKKAEGDWVTVILYADGEPLPIEDDFMQCLKDEPAALKLFNGFSKAEQQKFMDWIYAAKTTELCVSRMATAIDLIMAGQRSPQ